MLYNYIKQLLFVIINRKCRKSISINDYSFLNRISSFTLFILRKFAGFSPRNVMQQLIRNEDSFLSPDYSFVHLTKSIEKYALAVKKSVTFAEFASQTIKNTTEMNVSGVLLLMQK